MPPAVYPYFGQNYDIQNLFPLSLLDPGGYQEAVPINFRTNGERKFLITGLHSGGKSFFLENVVLLSVLAQLGVDVPANSITLPKYERIFYHRNPDNSRQNAGKLEKEMGEIVAIADQIQEGELGVFDEFLDSTSTEVATWLTPVLLDRLSKSKATVLVSTHRSVDYAKLEQDGWTIMSPEHEIKTGKVTPSKKLKRGIPDEEINRRFVMERYDDFLK